jgi:hypothetical protein
LIYDPSEWQIEEDEAISKMKTEELDRVVAAGTIREIDRESVRFIVRRIVQPPEQPDGLFADHVAGSALTRSCTEKPFTSDNGSSRKSIGQQHPHTRSSDEGRLRLAVQRLS